MIWNSSSVARNWSRKRLVAGFEREDRRGLVAELLLELIDGVGLLAKLGELRRGLGFHLLDAHFEASGRHREFGAQLILVGADLGDRQRRRRFEPPHRQAHGAVVHQRNEQQAKQRRNEESDAEIHDRFDHDATPPSPLRFLTQLARHAREGERRLTHATAGATCTTFTAVNLNRVRPQRHRHRSVSRLSPEAERSKRIPSRVRR